LKTIGIDVTRYDCRFCFSGASAGGVLIDKTAFFIHIIPELFSGPGQFLPKAFGADFHDFTSGGRTHAKNSSKNENESLSSAEA
jgi:hypothetical protein